MRTAIVILNWNTKEYLEKFLPSIISSATDAEVIVADSASNDGSMEMMAEKFPQIRRIELDDNYGFTGGYNRAFDAIKDEGFEYYLLLNSDIEVSKGWLEPLVAYMDQHPDCGACGPKLHSWYKKDEFEYAGAAGGFIDIYGYPFCRGRVMKRVEKDYGQYDTGVKDVFWITGACLLVRAEIMRELKLDDRFFAHMEEIDLCWRMQLQGWKVSVVPTSVVYHLGGGTLPATSPWKLKLNYRNNLLMLENNLAKTYALRLADGGSERAAKRGKFLARITILKRMMIDGVCALIYLCALKPKMFMSVIKAHSEYKKMRIKPNTETIISHIEKYHGEIQGMYPYWILPKAVLWGEKIFKTVKSI